MTNPLADDLEHILRHTDGLWDELRGGRLFVTGGTGFFGCWILESFLWANERLGLNAEAVVLTRRPDAFRAKAAHLAGHPSIRLVEGDVRTFNFPSGPFSHVIHAATEASDALNREEPLLMLDTIVAGTRRTMDFAVHCGARKILLTSSGAVYGRQPPELSHIPEEYAGGPDCCSPLSAYGEGKRLAELLGALYAKEHGLDVKVARCFAFVGPYQSLDTHFAICNFIRDCLRGGPIVVQGDGTPRRSYLYAADLAIALWTILMRGTACRPYNVGSEDSIAIADLAARVAASASPSCPVRVAKRALGGASGSSYVPSGARMAAELGIRPTASLGDALQRTLRWHRQAGAMDGRLCGKSRS